MKIRWKRTGIDCAVLQKNSFKLKRIVLYYPKKLHRRHIILPYIARNEVKEQSNCLANMKQRGTIRCLFF